MPIDIGSSSISGVSSFTNPESAVSKSYVDSLSVSTPLPAGTSSETEVLSNNGTIYSWQSNAKRQEYSTPGTYTYTIPPQATQLIIEATGGGGGGADGSALTTGFQVGTAWIQRTMNIGFNTPYFLRRFTDGALQPFTFCSVNTSNYLTTSTDSLVWQLRTTRLTTQILSIGQKPFGTLARDFFIGGGNGQINTSTDTIHWVLRTGPSGTHTHYGAAGGNNLYVFGSYNTTGPVGGVIVTSTNGIQWTLRTSGVTLTAGDPGPIWEVIFANGSFYGVFGNLTAGPHGLIASTDAIHWTKRTIPWANGIVGTNNNNSVANAPDTKGLVHLNNIFWCHGSVNSSGLYGVEAPIASSTDSIHWTRRTIGTGAGGLESSICYTSYGSLSYGNGNYLLTPGTTGTTAYASFRMSTDGIAWTVRTLRDDSDGIMRLRNFNYYHTLSIHDTSKNLFILAGTNGQYHISPSVTYGMAGGGGGGGASALIRLSRNEISGNTITVNVGAGGISNKSGTATTITWSSNVGISSMVVGAGQSGSNTGFCTGGLGGRMISSIPITLVPSIRYATGCRGGQGAYIPSPGSSSLNSDVYASGGGGGGGAYATSNYENTENIRLDSFPGGGSAIRMSGFSAGYEPGFYVNSNQTPQVSYLAFRSYSTTDLFAADRRFIPALGQFAGFQSKIDLSAKKLGDFAYGAGGMGAFASCSLGQTWTFRTVANTNNLNAVLCPLSTSDSRYFGVPAQKLFFACGANGACLTSTNSVVWSTRTAHPSPAPSVTAFSSIDHGYVYTIIAGAHISTTTDGIQWFRRTHGVPTTGAGPYFTKVKYIDTMHYAVGREGFNFTPILTVSTDAINWTYRNALTSFSSVSAYFWDIAKIQSSQTYIMGGNSRMLVSSTDTITWTLRTVPFSSSTAEIKHTTSRNNLFVVGNSLAEIATSTNGIHWTARTVGLSVSTYGAHSLSHIHYSSFIKNVNPSHSEGRFFASVIHTSTQGTVVSSTDAIHWTSKYTLRVTDNPITSLFNASSCIAENPPNSSSGIPPILLAAGNPGVFACFPSVDSFYNLDGGDGFRGGGGGGGACINNQSPVPAITYGGKGGDGYVRISWI